MLCYCGSVCDWLGGSGNKEGEKMRSFKYWLVLVISILVIVIGSGITTAFASSSFNNSGIMEDLRGSVIGGIPFDITDYIYDSDKEARVICFTEFCYSYKPELKGDYGLYVYVYNPGGEEIVGLKNSIQLASEYEGEIPTDYKKYTLQLCDVSEGEYSRLFYKFKLLNITDVYARVNASNTIRRYDVSGIELNYNGNITELEVGNGWVYSGFAKGCGTDEQASTLKCVTNDLETIKLNVGSSYYRYQNEASKQSQISCVYFGVSDKILSRFGKLQQIKAEWYEIRTAPAIVCYDKTIYNALYPYVGVDIGKHSDNIGYEFVTWPMMSDTYSWWGYNLQYWNASVIQSRLDWLMYSESGNVSTSDVRQYMTNYTKLHGGEQLLGKYSKNLFEEKVDAGRVYGRNSKVIDADALIDINGFESSGSGLADWFIHNVFPGIKDTPLSDIEPIYRIKSSDFDGITADVAERLYICEEDVASLKEEYSSNAASGKSTFLFRFAVTDYNAYALNVRESKYILFPTVNTDKAYMAQQTAFLDFDIIWLKFIRNDVESVIPAVSDPTDIIGGWSPSEVTGSVIPWWVWLIVVIVALLVVALIVKPVATVLIFIFKVIWWIVSAPVRLIIWIVRKSKEKGDV